MDIEILLPAELVFPFDSAAPDLLEAFADVFLEKRDEIEPALWPYINQIRATVDDDSFDVEDYEFAIDAPDKGILYAWYTWSCHMGCRDLNLYGERDDIQIPFTLNNRTITLHLLDPQVRDGEEF